MSRPPTSYCQPFDATHRTGKQLGQIGGLLVAMHRREYQLDGPLGAQAFGFQWIGQTQPADGQIGAVFANPVQLAINMLAFADPRRSSNS